MSRPPMPGSAGSLEAGRWWLTLHLMRRGPSFGTPIRTAHASAQCRPIHCETRRLASRAFPGRRKMASDVRGVD